MVPAAFSDEGPKRMDQFAQMAANAVRVLAPAMAGIPGLLVAAAVVQLPAGIPQVVITTNEGAGYLPAGCYLPQSMTHAFFDVDTLAFDNKWFGWVDPARILIDYVAVRSEALGGEVQLLGLASSGLVSADVKNLFPQVVPSVMAEQGSKPLGSDNGRNAHRLKVLSPSWFTDVQMSTPDVRNRAAVRATEAAMRLAVAAPLREAGGPWQIMQSGRMLDDAEWAMFAERYDQEIKMTGAVRPGFMTSSQPGQMGAQYVDRFQLVRAMETLLAWRNAPDVSPEDIIYTAHEAGADVSHVLD
ncbi:putative methyl-accepting chemotaxis sensory transducer [Mycobacteroides abscessus subsp. massiliense]|nr:putative methyl-accepting chemotaxis sensory transducer [Mycobacteroides abscessus subsp. massiliense]